MGRKEQKAATRERVLEAARACFDGAGFDGTTIADVARRAGVSVGSVMAHFEGKSPLMAAAYQADLQAVTDEAFDTLPTGDVHDKLQHIAAALYGFYAREPGRELLRESLFLEGEHGDAFQGWLTDLTGRVTQVCRASRTRRPADWVALGFFADWLAMLIAGQNGAFPTVEAQLAALDGLTRLRLQ